jgi:Uma2 family endonuclease
MTAQPDAPMTPEEYLDFERASETKHEFYDGAVLAMVGASYAHNLIVMNTGSNLYVQLDGKPCRVLPSDLRVSVEAPNSFVYPGLTVVCGAPQFGYGSPDTLLNPTVIIEVLSHATENHDRGQKFRLYRAIESLQEYLLIAQDTPRIEHFVRQTNNLWLFSESVGIDATLHLPTIDSTLALARVYRDIELSDQSTQPE